MVAFPTLSDDARFIYPEDIYQDPVYAVRFEDRSEEVRSRWQSGRWRFPVILQAPQSDIDTVLTFLKARRLRSEPFDFTHRDAAIGTTEVRYDAEELPRKRIVHGSPDWFEIELPLTET